ncbi:MAG: carbamoyltransferase [Planctomycetaceae bacterium]|jgi:carbamoyltransferase|nr:carbamoyltransferase [Planctomycetaceae bacterium]
MTYVLGISAYYHDSAAALIDDGYIIAAAQEERFTRIKQDSRFPSNAVEYVLAEAGIGLDQVDQIAFYDKPYLKFERLLETYHALIPKGLVSFWSAIPVWIREKLFLRQEITTSLKKIGTKIPQLYFPEHHLSHAASAFYPSPFDEAAILTIDGVGEWATTSLAYGKGNEITVLRELHFPHSVGLLYAAFTAYCGFRVNSGEYKLMGLAPYGQKNSERVKRWKELIYEHLIDLRSDGSLLMNQKYFDYATGLRMYNLKRWKQLFGIPPRKPETEISQEYMDMAIAVQEVTEDIVLRLVKTVIELTGCRNLVMAGGVALNCSANGFLLKQKIFDKLWIQPAAGDAGGSLGAALAIHHIVNGNKREIATNNIAKNITNNDQMQGAYLGPKFDSDDVTRMAKRHKAVYRTFNDREELCDVTSDLIADGNVVGWFQGRMEFGPRALGNRSILGDSRNPEMQKRLNLKIKYREGFRPFAPSVLETEIKNYFDIEVDSPYMLLVAPVVTELLNPLPERYGELPLYERLYFQRSQLPAITHVDYSARIQSVNESANPEYARLLRAFQKRHHCPVIVNTSFNVRGEPIVCTPDDAYRCFMRTEMDCLVIENILFRKNDQPHFNDKENWKKTFKLD